MPSWARRTQDVRVDQREPVPRLDLLPGTVSEQLEKPGEEIFDVIRYFGSCQKIFNVHFRNIEGGFLNFHETFIDNGSVDMLMAMRVYKKWATTA